MKILHRNFEKNGKGSLTLIPEEPEDMWHAFNLIREGDTVQASTARKVQTETSSGNTSSSRIRMTLAVVVETIDFDSVACILRLKGKNVQENEHVKLGAYHTLDLEQNRKFTILKEEWDSVALERIEMAADPTQNADAAAVIMQEGVAFVCLITRSMTIVRAKVEQNIAKKRTANPKQYQASLNKFYDLVLQGMLRHVNFSLVKVVLIASPAFVKDQFFQYVCDVAVKTDNKTLMENKGKFLLVHSSTGFKHSLKEVLADPAVMAKMADTKASAELKALQQFHTIFKSNPEKAFYGMDHVDKASEYSAIDTLLISDRLFRCQDVKERKRYVKLVDSVKESGGNVRIFSSLHPSGEELDTLTGVAAILRFPLPNVEDDVSK